jgi:hypothetical protein
MVAVEVSMEVLPVIERGSIAEVIHHVIYFKEATDQTPKKINNPAYDSWISRDQIVLGYLLQSIGSKVLPHVQRIETIAGVWQAIEEIFASQC